MTSIPIDRPERLLDVIVPVTTVGPVTDFPPFLINSVEGTGFILGAGFLVTCWHCVAAAPPEGCFYGVTRLGPEGQNLGSPIGRIRQVTSNVDLAVGRVRYTNPLGFRIAETAPSLGADVWTFGYPLTDIERLPNGITSFTAHPPLLKGHVTRPFVYAHPSGVRIPSWELSFAAPEGLSGAPVFLAGTLDIVGVVYGNNDVRAVEYEGFVDPETGERESAVHRVVSFGLAHHLTSLTKVTEFLEAPPHSDPPAA